MPPDPTSGEFDVVVSSGGPLRLVVERGAVTKLRGAFKNSVKAFKMRVSRLAWPRRRRVDSKSAIRRHGRSASQPQRRLVSTAQRVVSAQVEWGNDGAPRVASRKPPADPTTVAALAHVEPGDALLAVDGRSAAALTSDELVSKLQRRPVALRFRRGAPGGDAVDVVVEDVPPAAARTPPPPAPAARTPPPAGRVELTIPATERLLGFSVGRDGAAGCLVVTAVRPSSVLAAAGVPVGARLLTLNGEDVARLPLDELTQRASQLSHTERRVVVDW